MSSNAPKPEDPGDGRSQMSRDKEDAGYKGGFELDSPIGKVKVDASLPPSAGVSFARAVELGFSGLFPTTFDRAKNRTLKARIDEAVTNKMVQAIDSIDHREIYAALLNYRLREDANMLEGRAEILAIAAEQLAAPGRGAKIGGDTHPISDDFLTHFWRTADRISNAEMRIIFSRILSGEIARPGSFSASTLSLVATLHPRDATNFELMCRMALSNGSHSFVVVNATHADRPHLESNTVTSGTNIGEYLVDFGIHALSRGCRPGNRTARHRSARNGRFLEVDAHAFPRLTKRGEASACMRS
ncbi:hypothetical protein MesoLj131c_22100 [Mesorhizobium sp. 131-3-5]|nr:hypothetical protein MesoLj131c_22100 [Mesorhizobium sp. 131-3-5]